MQSLISHLLKIKKLGVIAIKQSLEDEGASFEDIKKMRAITSIAKLKLNVKVGGCEAKNDIFSGGPMDLIVIKQGSINSFGRKIKESLENEDSLSYNHSFYIVRGIGSP